MTVHEMVHPEYTTYFDGASKNDYVVEENNLKVYETATSVAQGGMAMRATFVDKDETARRKAQWYQTWVKGQQRKLAERT